MRVSSRGEYGARALLDLALHGPGVVQAEDIARRQEIPESYLNQLLIALRKAGLITSKRGPRGGHALARHPSQIDMAEVILALEGSTAPAACVDEETTDECGLAGRCTLRRVWQRVKRATDAILEGTTLEDLRRRQQEMEGRLMYHI